jgi:hypothetical protein
MTKFAFLVAESLHVTEILLSGPRIECFDPVEPVGRRHLDLLGVLGRELDAAGLGIDLGHGLDGSLRISVIASMGQLGFSSSVRIRPKPLTLPNTELRRPANTISQPCAVCLNTSGTAAAEAGTTSGAGAASVTGAAASSTSAGSARLVAAADSPSGG